MSRQIVVHPEVATFVAQRCGGEFFCDPYVAIGVAHDGELLAGVVLNGFTGRNIDISGAGEPRAWTRAFLKRIADYVWLELECLRASFIVRADDPHVIRFVERLGGIPEGPAVNWFGEQQDGVRYTITRDHWKLTR